MLHSRRVVGSFLTYMLVAVGTFAISAGDAQAGPKSACRWVLDRDEGPVEGQSNVLIQFGNLKDCTNDAVVGMMTADFDSGPKAFNGKIFFKTNGKVVTCTTETIKPFPSATWYDRTKMWIVPKRNQMEFEAYFKLLEDPAWKKTADQHVRVRC